MSYSDIFDLNLFFHNSCSEISRYDYMIGVSHSITDPVLRLQSYVVERLHLILYSMRFF